MLEFGAREWGMVGKNKIEIESKKEFKRKQGYSPDKADAVAIGLELARRKGFIIQSLRSGRDDDNAPDERWKADMREKARKHWRSGELAEEAA